MSESDENGAPWHSKRWLVVLAVFFAIVSLVIVGVAATAHLKWQSSPEKALLDALDYSAKTPATYKVATKDIDAVVSYDGKRSAAKGTYKSIAFNAIVDGSTLYVKSSTPAELVRVFTPKNLPTSMQSVVDAITKRITDRWVSVSLDSLPSSSAYETQNVSCITTADTQLKANKEAKKELATLYAGNKFLAIEKTATTDKSHAYTIGVDNALFDAFVGDLKTSKFYNSLKSECARFVQSTTELKANHGAVTADIMLSKSKNALQSLTLKTGASDPVKVAVSYGSVGTINAPTDSISYNSITNGVIQTVLQAYLNNR